MGSKFVGNIVIFILVVITLFITVISLTWRFGDFPKDMQRQCMYKTDEFKAENCVCEGGTCKELLDKLPDYINCTGVGTEDFCKVNPEFLALITHNCNGGSVDYCPSGKFRPKTPCERGDTDYVLSCGEGFTLDDNYGCLIDCPCGSNSNCNCAFDTYEPICREKNTCELNPRDDETCRCVENKSTNRWTRAYSCPNSCYNATRKKCQIRGLYSYNKEVVINGVYEDFGDMCQIINIADIANDITSFSNITMIVTQENVTRCEQCFEYEQLCIKAETR